MTTIEPDDVNIWHASLDLPAEQIEALGGALSPDERERAGRFVRAADSRRFIAGRGILRSLLSRATGVEPSSVSFAYNEYGRPFLAPVSGLPMVIFNVSHSAGKALYALSARAPVGIDLERIRPSPNFSGIAERFFTPAEASALRSLPERQRLDAFFTCWTRKEAFVKAVGKGLYSRLDHVEVSLLPGEPPAILRIADGGEDARDWRMFDIDAGDGYKAAVAVKSRHPRLITHQFHVDGQR